MPSQVMGGCQLGPDPATSVVDTTVRHHRVHNLFVVDGSVFPTSLGVNPSQTIYGIAHWARQHVAAAVGQGGGCRPGRGARLLLSGLLSSESAMPGKLPPQQSNSQSTSTSQTTQQTQSTEQVSNSERKEELEQQPELTPAQKAAELAAKLGTNIGQNPLRLEYQEAVAAMSSEIEPMRREGKSDEQIARALHQKRIDIGKQYKELTPEPLRAFIFELNMKRYQNEYGPSVEYLLKKYNGDWNKIIEGACRPNGSIDRLLASFGQWLQTIDAGRLDAWYTEWCT